jgi:hypothetical protein
MSSDHNPTNKSDRPPAMPKQSRHPLVSVIMVLIGIVLLLPGVCAVLFAGAMGRGADSSIVMLWLLSIAIAIGGIMLIIKAFR